MSVLRVGIFETGNRDYCWKFLFSIFRVLVWSFYEMPSLLKWRKILFYCQECGHEVSQILMLSMVHGLSNHQNVIFSVPFLL